MLSLRKLLMNYKILTDTSSDLPFDVLDSHDISVIGLVVNFDGQEFVEDDWKSISADKYYSAMKNGALPTTSQITPQRFYDYFKPYLEKGLDILYIGFSSSLSGTFGASNIAKDMLTKKFPERRIELVDSMSASAGQALLLLGSAKLKEEGKTMDEVISFCEENKMNVNHIFTVDDLNHLRRGGRVSGFSAAMGTMLNVKPILYMSEEGKLLNIEKVKGRKKSLMTLVDYLEKGSTDQTADVIIAHGNCEDDAKNLKKQIKDRGLSNNVRILTLGMTIGAHTGANVINMVFLGKHREDTVKKN